MEADASALGDPALMSPKAVQAWIQQLKAEASAVLKKV
jgi:hypothetical protein